MFVVYENNVRCSELNVKGWDVDSFKSKREAEIFAFMWAFPFTKEEAEMSAPDMEIGKDYDMSMSDCLVNMKIEYLHDLVYNCQAADYHGCKKRMKEVLLDLGIRYEVSNFIEMSAQYYLYNCYISSGDFNNLPAWIEVNKVRTHPKTQDLYVW